MVRLLKYSFIVIGSVLLLAELYYRFTGIHKVYLETIGEKYYSGYNQVLPSWYHMRHPGDTFTPSNVDFFYPFSINAWGIRDKEVTNHPADSIVRILVTGDSYAEGMGAPYDSTWPRLLEKELIANGIKAEVIDAGSAGSDIWFDYMAYRDILHKLKPDLVIAAMNSSDYTDYMLRGGLQRFHADSTTHFRKSPWWEPLFHYSHLFRAILYKYVKYPFTAIFLSEKDCEVAYINGTAEADSTLRLYNKEATKHGAGFVTVYHIIPPEIKYGHVHLNKFVLAKADSLYTHLNNTGTNAIDISKPMTQQYGDSLDLFYHLRDGHYNPRGYAVMARIIADSLVQRGMAVK